jgi:hypothetical protein
MKGVASCVREIVDESELALDAIRDGLLNLTAYAKKIRPEVIKRARRDVSTGSIVVALCRYEIDVKKRPPVCPKVEIESVSTRTGLTEITFNKNAQTQNQLRSLQADPRIIGADVVTIISGIRELSLIVPSALTADVLRAFEAEKPVLLLENLASITLRFPPQYINKPNTTFAMLRPLALRRINLVEVVSTFTELSIIVAQRDLQAVFLTYSR